MKLYEILKPQSYQKIDFSEHPFGMSEFDTDEYFFGGWVEAATGKMVNVFTNPNIMHHIQYIIDQPEMFGMTAKELGIRPHEQNDITSGDVTVGRWGEFEEIINKVVQKGRWVRFYLVHSRGREMGFTATKQSIQKVRDSGTLAGLIKRFNPDLVMIELLNPDKSASFALPNERAGMLRWLDQL